MSPKQKKIAAKAPPPDKIDGKDFAVLKAEKAKGRGMGLQDESIKPGKVMKANKGKMTPIKKDPTTPVNPFEKRRKQLGGGRSKLPGRIGTTLGVISMLVPAGMAAAKQYKDYKSAKNRDKAKVKKFNKGGGADTGRMGEMKSKISVAMDRASRRSRDKDRLTQRDIDFIRRRSRNQDRITPGDIQGPMKKERFNQEQEQRLKNLSTKELFGEVGFSKKMGGGMMQRPMGYTSGGDAKKSKPASPQKKPENKYNSGPDLRPDPDILGNRLDKKLKKYYGSKETELHAGYKNDKRPFPDLGEDIAEKRAMKEVLQEAGIKFKTGGSVMARGCKLGRTKKTKLY